MDVFVSYSSKDTDVIKKMCEILRRHDISCWVSYENEDFGSSYAATIVKEISECGVFLLFVSEASNDSIHVLNEVNCAVGRKKTILPVLIEDVELSPSFEYYLASTHWLNYMQSEDFEHQLTHRIRTLLGKPEEKAESAAATVAVPETVEPEEPVIGETEISEAEEPEKTESENPESLPDDMVDETDTVTGVAEESTDNEYKTLDSEKLDDEESDDIKDNNENKGKKEKIKAVIFAFMTLLVIAVVLFLVFFKDSSENQLYADAEAALVSGNKAQAAILFGKAANEGYADARERSFALWNEVAQRETIAAGGSHSVAVKSDGRVVAVGWDVSGQCDVSGWTDIVAVSTGYYHTVGLKSDGRVVATKFVDYTGSPNHSEYDYEGQCDVSGWADIIAVSAGYAHTVGIKSDGTVVAVGGNEFGQCNISNWTDIIAVSAGYGHTVGLKSDGTVVAVGENEDGQCKVGGWTDIVAVSAGDGHTVGLKSDGTVVAVGHNYNDQCDVSGWTDIVDISAGNGFTLGLKADGTVVACSYVVQDFVSDWTDIVVVSAGDDHAVGFNSDGTVVATGDNFYGQCDVSGWTDIKQP